MSRVALSHLASPSLRAYLRSAGHDLHLVRDDPRYGPGVESHADLRFCKIGADGPVLAGGAPPSPAYPDNAAMCAVVTRGFLIHRLDITHPAILRACRERGFREIHVRQGYTRCSCLPVDDRSFITCDPGIGAALSRVPELSVLPVQAGHVLLPGFDMGFLGGAAGRVDGEIVFDGDLSAHPDFQRICAFIRERGLTPRYFPDHKLTDIGSVIQL